MTKAGNRNTFESEDASLYDNDEVEGKMCTTNDASSLAGFTDGGYMTNGYAQTTMGLIKTTSGLRWCSMSYILTTIFGLAC